MWSGLTAGSTDIHSSIGLKWRNTVWPWILKHGSQNLRNVDDSRNWMLNVRNDNANMSLRWDDCNYRHNRFYQLLVTYVTVLTLLLNSSQSLMSTTSSPFSCHLKRQLNTFPGQVCSYSSSSLDWESIECLQRVVRRKLSRLQNTESCFADCICCCTGSASELWINISVRIFQVRFPFVSAVPSLVKVKKPMTNSTIFMSW